MTYFSSESNDSESCRGVRIERRALFFAPAALAVGTLGDAAHVRAEDELSEAPLGFDGFVDACKALAAKHFEGGRIDADVYMHRLAAVAQRLTRASVPKAELADFGAYAPPVRTGIAARALPILVIQWRLEPGAVLPPHNHTPGNVLSLCLEGECRVTHFEIEGDAPAPGAEGAFRLRKTLERLLTPGRSSTLTSGRDNIHTFRAGKRGALGIDINTFLPGEGDWSMIAAERDQERDVAELYDATWIGKPG